MKRLAVLHLALLFALAAPSSGAAQASQSLAESSIRLNADAWQSGLAAELGRRVQPGDGIELEDRSGVKTRGRLVRLSDDEITLDANSAEAHFKWGTVQKVSLRSRHIGTAMLVGAGGFVLYGALTECHGGKEHYCAESIVMGSLFGGLGGLLAGQFIHTSTIVYPLPERRVSVQPIISRDAVGLRASMRW
jgi:hypothetical protein